LQAFELLLSGSKNHHFLESNCGVVRKNAHVLAWASLLQWVGVVVIPLNLIKDNPCHLFLE